MAQRWQDVRKNAVQEGHIDETRVAQKQCAQLARVRAHRLAELRAASGLNQTLVAEKLGISQSRVSRIERGDVEHTELATLRAFVAALGGELEVVVKAGDQRIQIA